MSATAKVITLKDNFGPISKAVTGKQLTRAVLAGGYVIEGQAKINVNQTFSAKSTGGAGLAGSIQTVLSKSSETSAWVDVGPTVIYGRIQELGGIVKPVFAKLLSWVDDGVRIFAKMVQIPARPYLRPAVDEHEREILQAVGYQLRQQIEAAAE
jgi:phage gpG-like protein